MRSKMLPLRGQLWGRSTWDQCLGQVIVAVSEVLSAQMDCEPLRALGAMERMPRQKMPGMHGCDILST